jgi:hypothetical protein
MIEKTNIYGKKMNGKKGDNTEGQSKRKVILWRIDPLLGNGVVSTSQQ